MVTKREKGQADGDAESLFERLGGDAAIADVVDTFYEKVLADESLSEFFEDVDMRKLKRHQRNFLSHALGGPKRVAPHVLRTAHQHLNIQAEHFQSVAEHLGASLREHGVGDDIIEQVLDLVGSLQSEVVSDGKSGAVVGVEGVLGGLTAALDAVQANVFVADAKFKMVYANPRAIETLEAIEGDIEGAFGVSVDEIVGGSIHRFHSNPRAVERILKNPRALPHEARFTFGKITLRSAINSITDSRDKVVGYIVNWEDVTAQELAEEEIARVTAMVENSPTAVVVADRELVIRYINPATDRMLRPLERYLKVAVSDLVGTNVDAFHERPEVQRRILSDDKNLPYTANIKVGPETLRLLASPIYDRTGRYLGPMVTWEVVTQKLLAELEVARVRALVENSPTAVVLADRDLVIRYINPATRRLLQPVEAHLPVTVNQLIGSNIDIFHKEPEKQRRILRDPKNLPAQAQIRVGAEIINLMASAVYDGKGEYLGPMVTWESVTEKLRVEQKTREVSEMVTGSSQRMRDVAQQLTASAEETSTQANQVATAAEQVNANTQSVASGTAELVTSIREIARNAMEAAKVAADAVESAEATGMRISKLGESSKDIGQVIKVITGIAQQTNLLALNATIEAARAGEAGKGFAVVANEVKELAKETARATEDISRKIEAIQGDTASTVDAISTISGIVQKISEIQNNIASSVEEQQVTTNDIARSIAEASKGAQEIAMSIAGVADAAKQVAGGAGTTQEAAGDLQGLSEQLERLVRTKD